MCDSQSSGSLHEHVWCLSEDLKKLNRSRFVYIGVAVIQLFTYFMSLSFKADQYMLSYTNVATFFIYLFILEREFAACFTWEMAIFRYQLIVWEDRGRTERRWGGGAGGGGGDPPGLSSPHPPPSLLLSSCCTGMAWERPTPLARRHPAKKYNTNSIKCSLRCDLTAMNDKLVVVLTL